VNAPNSGAFFVHDDRRLVRVADGDSVALMTQAYQVHYVHGSAAAAIVNRSTYCLPYRRMTMKAPFNVPSDVPVDPVPDNDLADSPVPPVNDEDHDSAGGLGKEIPE
jgi:hypothetical protein